MQSQTETADSDVPWSQWYEFVLKGCSLMSWVVAAKHAPEEATLMGFLIPAFIPSTPLAYRMGLPTFSKSPSLSIAAPHTNHFWTHPGMCFACSLVFQFLLCGYDELI